MQCFAVHRTTGPMAKRQKGRPSLRDTNNSQPEALHHNFEAVRLASSQIGGWAVVSVDNFGNDFRLDKSLLSPWPPYEIIRLKVYEVCLAYPPLHQLRHQRMTSDISNNDTAKT